MGSELGQGIRGFLGEMVGGEGQEKDLRRDFEGKA
jgi:hypothetical protein